MINLDNYDGILVCGDGNNKDNDRLFEGNIHTHCECGAAIVHRPIPEGVDHKLLPVCLACAMAIATSDDREPEVKTLPGAEEEFDEVYGRGVTKASVEVITKKIKKVRRALGN